MSKKKYGKCDELGRLTLPHKAVQELGLYQNEKLLVSVHEPKGRIIMRPTDEQRPAFTTGQDKKKEIEEMRQKPTSEWRSIRSMDRERRVIPPLIMRKLLDWPEDT